MDDVIERLSRAVLRRSPDVAHDLKTPLNIIVLSIELLQMRLRSLDAELAEDGKIREYCRSIERETRRIAAIADGFLSVASMPEEDAVPVDLVDAIATALEKESFEAKELDRVCRITAHPARVAQAAKLLARGIGSIVDPRNASIVQIVEADKTSIVIAGPPVDERTEFGKLLKFYYTDASGEANLSLVLARLLLESIGGSLELEVSQASVQFTVVLQGDE